MLSRVKLLFAVGIKKRGKIFKFILSLFFFVKILNEYLTKMPNDKSNNFLITSLLP
jgi:hypothetical protein